MKKYGVFTIGLALLLMIPKANAQENPRAFYKYCVVTSITWGPGKAIYTTKDYKGEKVYSQLLNAQIDPIITEYGLTNKIGLGFSKGGDNFDVNVNKFYRQNLPEDTYNNMMWVSTKYFTFDASYHYFNTKRLDLSVFSGVGYYKLSGNNGYSDSSLTYHGPSFSYNAHGGVIRSGARVRWYFSKRFGFMANVYAYKAFVREPYKRNFVSDANGSGGFSTTLTGVGSELGICFRIGKQKNVKTIQTERTKKAKKQRKPKKEDIEYDPDKKPPLFTLVWD